MLETLTCLCWNCGNLMFTCPECVATTRIDPETNLPAGWTVDADGRIVVAEPTGEQQHRTVKQAICETCVPRLFGPAGPKKIGTFAERHYRHQRDGLMER